MRNDNNKILLTLDDDTKDQLDHVATVLRVTRLTVIRESLTSHLSYLLHEEIPRVEKAREAAAERFMEHVRALPPPRRTPR